ncbi:hypothetical protein [Ruania zhangjianzhongii]|nr:hypothetical protein [Ruania zhangjianzhongii]
MPVTLHASGTDLRSGDRVAGGEQVTLATAEVFGLGTRSVCAA